MTSNEEEICVKWNGDEYTIVVQKDEDVGDLKRRLGGADWHAASRMQCIAKISRDARC